MTQKDRRCAASAASALLDRLAKDHSLKRKKENGSDSDTSDGYLSDEGFLSYGDMNFASAWLQPSWMH